MVPSVSTEADSFSSRKPLQRTVAGSDAASVTPSFFEATVVGSCCRSWSAATPATHPTSSTSCSPTGGTVPSPHPSRQPLLPKQAPTPRPLAPGWRKSSPSADIPITRTREVASTPKPQRCPRKPASLPGSP